MIYSPDQILTHLETGQKAIRDKFSVGESFSDLSLTDQVKFLLESNMLYLFTLRGLLAIEIERLKK